MIGDPFLVYLEANREFFAAIDNAVICTINEVCRFVRHQRLLLTSENCDNGREGSGLFVLDRLIEGRARRIQMLTNTVERVLMEAR